MQVRVLPARLMHAEPTCGFYRALVAWPSARARKDAIVASGTNPQATG